METIRRQIGPHQIEIQGDLMRVRPCGPYLPAEAREFLELSDSIYRQHGSLYTLSDMTQAETPGPETRRILATWPYLGDYVSIMYGTKLNLVQRAMLQLVESAYRILTPLTSRRNMTLHFCATEAEALQFLEQHRQNRSPRGEPKQ
ncbi:MAG TPA: hypothetical protein PKI03_01400 [Pseudomonadota bacterium]|nr:hypothetical protein [Pseudomonadota bacterium]